MDPLMVMVLGVLGFVGMLGWGLVALVIAVGYRRVPRFSGAMAVVSALVFWGSGALLPPGYDSAEHDRIKSVHAGFAPVLERYRQAHGEYPVTLEAAGIATPQTRYGPLRYTSEGTEDGAVYYSVIFGDYLGNGFTAYFDSRSGKWQIYSSAR